ncbi:glycosyltransferase family 25 protein [Halomonas piscis]|uniref:glycosyltransferase family 25 protein n=1 Tax=Halomonas piscis TaxID=3031727 RepID=UPI00289BCBD0|nr:glycosyltransferase family 25 protein [Halomonas piscis]
MKIIVISRRSDTRRRDNIRTVLKACPYEWDFLDAYEAGTLPGWFEAIYDESKARRYRSYPLVGGEKGCFASHMRAWVKCVYFDEPVIVLEDDSVLSADFWEKVSIMESSGFDYVKLERRSGGDALDGIFMVNHKNRSATTGYYLTPVGAFKFLSALNKIYMPVDHYIGMAWRHTVAPIGLIEPVVTNEASLGTSIQQDRQREEKINSKNRWLRFLRKLRRYVDDFKYRRFIKKL